MECINLKTKNPADRIALRGVRVHAVLAAMGQRTVVEQTFINREAHPIEAIYTFPLPDDAAVCGFEVLTGDRVLTGVIEETDAAIEKYDSAVAAGDGAYMTEQERPDVFTLRVGNIKPHQAALIRLTYVSPLDVNDNQIRVTFPTTVAPRFISSSGMEEIDAAIDGDALNPPHVPSVPYGLTFSAEVRLGRKVSSITSPSHRITVTGEGDEQRLKIDGTAAMDREVVLNIELAKEYGPCVQLEEGSGNQSFLAVSFVPEFDSQPRQPSASETIFVLDCSGSMAGSSMIQAVAALELCLRSLSEGDTFNICKFGSTYDLMKPEPVVYSQATLDAALRYIASKNNLGGTELFQPLERVMTILPASGVVRSVILLTDGQVTNEPALLKMARKYRGRNRIFSFGIGPACSKFLVNGLARVTGGAAEFTAQNEKIHEKVLRTFARLNSPLVHDVEIDWDGAEAQTLAAFPPVFDGEVLTVFARVLGRKPGKITLKCQTDDGEKSWTVDAPRHPIAGGSIGTLWARRTIQSLEDVNGVTRSALAAGKSREREEIVRLSKEFGLLSSLTTFIALEHRSVEERNSGQPATQRVPVQLASGWGGIEQPVVGGRGGHKTAAGATRSISLFSKRRMRGSGGAAAGGTIDSLCDSFDSAGKTLHEDAASDDTALGSVLDLSRIADDALGGSAPAPASAAAEIVGDLEWILMQQTAAGDLPMDARIEQIALAMGNWSDLSAKAEALIPADARDREKAIDTMLVMAVLIGKFAADEPLWKRAAEKASRYLAILLNKDAVAILTEVRKLITETG